MNPGCGNSNAETTISENFISIRHACVGRHLMEGFTGIPPDFSRDAGMTEKKETPFNKLEACIEGFLNGEK